MTLRIMILFLPAYDAAMMPDMIHEAFGAEARQLSRVLAGLDDAAFARPTACDPWTVAELAYHVRMIVGRLPGMLAAPEPAGPGPRLRGRATTGRTGGSLRPRTPTGSSPRSAGRRPWPARRPGRAISSVARRQAELALRDAAPGRVVRTRHGDPMLLTEFLRTRVLELAVHGLDLAAALDREPWMTTEAAQVTEDLLLPCGAAGLRAETGWDRVGLIARLTGRHPVTPAETELIESAGIGRLALG